MLGDVRRQISNADFVVPVRSFSPGAFGFGRIGKFHENSCADELVCGRIRDGQKREGPARSFVLLHALNDCLRIGLKIGPVAAMESRMHE
jgi:hypothetical protein